MLLFGVAFFASKKVTTKFWIVTKVLFLRQLSNKYIHNFKPDIGWWQLPVIKILSEKRFCCVYGNLKSRFLFFSTVATVLHRWPQRYNSLCTHCSFFGANCWWNVFPWLCYNITSLWIMRLNILLIIPQQHSKK